MAIPFAPILVVGAALLALWIDTRRPSLAPDALSHRVLAAGAALLALQVLPVSTASAAGLYASVFALLLPALVGAMLSAVWLLRALRDVQYAH